MATYGAGNGNYPAGVDDSDFAEGGWAEKQDIMTAQEAFNNTLEIASFQPTITGIIIILKSAQKIRTHAGNLGCDGDLLYDVDANIHCGNIIQQILEIMEKEIE